MDSNVYANLVALAQQSVANQMRFYADNQQLDERIMHRFGEGGDDDGETSAVENAIRTGDGGGDGG